MPDFKLVTEPYFFGQGEHTHFVWKKSVEVETEAPEHYRELSLYDLFKKEL